MPKVAKKAPKGKKAPAKKAKKAAPKKAAPKKVAKGKVSKAKAKSPAKAAKVVKKGKKKDPNAPKRGLSAFFFFCGDERAKVKAAHPSYGIGDIGKELGARWGKVSAKDKAMYQAKSNKDKARYEAAMKTYKKK